MGSSVDVRSLIVIQWALVRRRWMARSLSAPLQLLGMVRLFYRRNVIRLTDGQYAHLVLLGVLVDVEV